MGNIFNPKPKELILSDNCKKCKQIPAYIVSMSDELYENARDRIKKFGLENINKFNAVRGDSLHSFIENPKNVSIKGLYDIKLQNTRGADSELTTVNSVGCTMSHIKLWKKIVNEKLPGLMIFETDCVCNGDILDCLGEFLKLKNAHILYFGYNNANIIHTGIITKINVRTYGTHAYYITYEGAKILLKNAFPIEQQLDSYMSDMLLLSQDDSSLIPEMNVYVCKNLCYQYIHESAIQTKIVSYY